jgi:hypothetical protein
MESERYYILGSFANSPGGKIIFFPGTIDSKLIKTSDEGEILSKGILHNIDHISLEPRFRVYHVTLNCLRSEDLIVTRLKNYGQYFTIKRDLETLRKLTSKFASTQQRYEFISSRYVQDMLNDKFYPN